MSKARQLADLGNQVDDGAITGTNMVINGAMQVAQRGTSSTADGYTTVDRWRPASLSTDNLAHTYSQSTDAPAGFSNSFKLNVDTAETTLNADESWKFAQRFEGQNLQMLAKGTSDAKALTVSFWVKSSTTGTYICELDDRDNTRAYSQAYTINSADTWEYKTLTYAGDTTGALDNDNEQSFRLTFMLAAGSNFTSGTLTTGWASRVDANRFVGQTNLMAATNNYWQITGVCMNVGDSAIDFPHDESYGDTLAKCKRYFERIGIPAGSNYQSFGVGHVHTSVTAVSVIPYSVEKRANPTASYDTGSNFAMLNASGGAVACTAASTSRITTHAVSVTANASGLVVGNATFLLANNTAKPFIDIDAEL